MYKHIEFKVLLIPPLQKACSLFFCFSFTLKYALDRKGRDINYSFMFPDTDTLGFIWTANALQSLGANLLVLLLCWIPLCPGVLCFVVSCNTKL